jgi:hypothetical protein
MGIGCMEMVIGRISSPADSETIAIFIGMRAPIAA